MSVTSGSVGCESADLGPDNTFIAYCGTRKLIGNLTRVELDGALPDGAVFYPVAGPALSLFERDRSSDRFATTQHVISE
ncbi:MAG: hypothetical protein ACPGRZ_00095 [Alphaproteobacteria bacterium]